MDENKQIEGMAKAIIDREKHFVCGYSFCKNCELKKCDLHCSKYSDIIYDCETLYNAGYRKQSDTIREFVGKLKNEITALYDLYKKDYQSRSQDIARKAWERMEAYEQVDKTIDELAKEYGVEVEE